MNLSGLPLFAALDQNFAWLSQRQEVLAQNIANADTPDYTPRDVERPSFARMLSNAARGFYMRTTSALHLGGASGTDGEFKVIKDENPTETNTVGNAVVLEEELMKVAKTASDFQLTANLYKKHIDLVKLALGRGPGA